MAENEQRAASNDRTEENSFWINKWHNRDIHFHLENMHISLQKHLDKLTDGRNEIKVLFPLCGKCVDMKELADRGYCVVGIDVAEQALREFFSDQNLEHTVEELENNSGKRFTSKDGKIKLYCMDIFNFSKDIEGQFNAIWDRGALVALNPQIRTRYIQLIKELLAPESRYMVATMQYDPSKYSGPPYNVREDDLQNLFGDVFSIELIDENDNSSRFKESGLVEIYERVYLLKIK